MNKYGFVGAIVATVVTLDQLTKWYIDRTLQLHQSVTVIDSLFDITYVRNTGGAFGLFSDQHPALRIPFFLTVSAIALVALVYFLRQVQPHQRVLQFALAGILAGALGNLIDRLTVGEVVDFLDFHWRGYHWPAFNVADCFISIGATILILHSLFAPPAETGEELVEERNRT